MTKHTTKLIKLTKIKMKMENIIKNDSNINKNYKSMYNSTKITLVQTFNIKIKSKKIK